MSSTTTTSTEVLLISETAVKAASNISDNIAGKYILSAIREAQEVGLRSVLGDRLLDKLTGLVADGEIDSDENAAYKTLIEACRYYLVYTTVVELIYKVSYHIANAGVTRNSDTNLAAATREDIDTQVEYYRGKADAYLTRLQNYLLENRDSYPELSQTAIHAIRANLYSSASSGIWLGGPRGKVSPGRWLRKGDKHLGYDID